MAPRASLLALAAASLAASVHATSRGLLQFTPAQSQNLANLQTQATAAQQAQQQAALQLAQVRARRRVARPTRPDGPRRRKRRWRRRASSCPRSTTSWML
jgi:hypothetical protein